MSGQHSYDPAFYLASLDAEDYAVSVARELSQHRSHAMHVEWYVAVLVLALGAAGCSFESSGGCRGTQHLPDLTGEWNWVKSSGTFAGATWTPEDTGKTEAVVVSDNCALVKFEAGKEVGRSGFDVRTNRDTTLYFSNPDLFPFGRQYLRMRTRDELILAGMCSDCVLRMFTRDKSRN